MQQPTRPMQEKKIREEYHSFWNNHLYGDGDTEPLYPTYDEIVNWWLAKLAQEKSLSYSQGRSDMAEAVRGERERVVNEVIALSDKIEEIPQMKGTLESLNNLTSPVERVYVNIRSTGIKMG